MENYVEIAFIVQKLQQTSVRAWKRLGFGINIELVWGQSSKINHDQNNVFSCLFFNIEIL